MTVGGDVHEHSQAGLSRRHFLGTAAAAAVATGLPARAAAAHTRPEYARWLRQAARVTITRDDWGVAHVEGRSDADAVFGMIYAQAEDDFPRIERNYLVSLGRLAEAEGEAALWQDLRQRLFIDPEHLRRSLYPRCPNWLRRLMEAWADGLNFFLATHPEVRPQVLRRFEPWMALSFSEGSIGGDIERVALAPLRAFYEGSVVTMEQEPEAEREPSGSNGIAIAPHLTRDGKALLLINPHTSFYFRSEQHVTSREGLDAYGAATWGQFFIYQGFNSDCGWMHTSTGVDNVDEFAETIVTGPGANAFYRYGGQLRPVTRKTVTLSYRTATGGLGTRTFTTFATHHGPIVRQTADGKWVAFALMNKPVEALQQSFLRTKARNYWEYLTVAGFKANSSNNTVFADSRGNIAHLMPQFMPVRDDRFDFRQPVDGSDPATDWQGLHSLQSLPQAVNPRSGFVFNTNNWPWTAAGPGSPRAADFPRYFDSSENDRGRHALNLLSARTGFTPQSLRDLAYDSYLLTFARLIPELIAAWDRLPAGDAQKLRLAEPIALLRAWDFRWGVESTATSLAVFWGAGPRADDVQRLASLDAAVARLTEDFGRWQVPWGEINRFQRNDGAINQVFDDAKPSIPIPFVSGNWGSLASYGSSRRPGTKRFYGTSGNTFVAIVEFGRRVRAWAVREGGNSGNPASPHFKDQAERYAAGNLRPVYFHPHELWGHVERRYRPGR